MLEAASPYGVIAVRCCLAAVFLYSGLDKLWYWHDAVDEVGRLGLRRPKLAAVLTILTQLIGGAMVAAGWNTAAGAILLAGFTVAATLLGHPFWRRCGREARREFTTALEHLAIVAGLSLLTLDTLLAR